MFGYWGGWSIGEFREKATEVIRWPLVGLRISSEESQQPPSVQASAIPGLASLPSKDKIAGRMLSKTFYARRAAASIMVFMSLTAVRRPVKMARLTMAWPMWSSLTPMSWAMGATLW